MKSGIKTYKLHWFGFRYGVNQFLGNLIFQTEQKRTFSNGKDFLAIDCFCFNFFSRSKTCFEKNFIEQIFRCGFVIDMLNMEFKLFSDFFWSRGRFKFLPLLKVGFIKF